jgi:hypothetical protein
MVRTSSMIRVFVAMALLCAGVTYAQTKPVQDVNARISPNLAAAQTYMVDAFNKLTLSQTINNDDMNGHAANAKNLLIQASNEVSAAAKAAYANQSK